MSKSNIVFNLGLSDINLVGKLVPKKMSYWIAALVSVGLIGTVVFLTKRECRKKNNKRFAKQMCSVIYKYLFSRLVLISLSIVLIVLLQQWFYGIHWNYENREVLNNHSWIKRLIDSNSASVAENISV